MNKGLKILGGIALGILIVSLVGWLTMSLWNWLVPELFHGPMLTFWQALGLLLLTKILLFRPGGRHHGGPPRWKKNLRHRWAKMSPEEREAFKQKIRDRWCQHGESGAPATE